mgnify:CR=1 FL=1
MKGRFQAGENNHDYLKTIPNLRFSEVTRVLIETNEAINVVAGGTGQALTNVKIDSCEVFCNYIIPSPQANQLIEAGKQVDEEVWRLPCDPIGERYDKYVDSTIADMHNVGKGGEASSTTAAQFLQRFVNDTPWTHIDIAGVTWNDKGSMTASGGATGWGVKLLNKWVDNLYG